MATWPASLPQLPLNDGYEETFPDTAIATGMDVGPVKKRGRISYNVKPIGCKLTMTTAQVETLETFFSVTTQGGAIPFDWTNFRTGVTASLSFTGPPKITRYGTRYLVSLGLEIMP